MIRGLLATIGLVLAAGVLLGVASSPFLLIDYWASAAKCHSQWDRSGRPVQYTFMGGCMVQRADTTWVPASALRDLN